MATSPRPILKCNRKTANLSILPTATQSPLRPLSQHVHFPSTPFLTSSHATHSSAVYDRKPLKVGVNLVSMPERGGRVYGLELDMHHDSDLDDSSEDTHSVLVKVKPMPKTSRRRRDSLVKLARSRCGGGLPDTTDQDEFGCLGGF